MTIFTARRTVSGPTIVFGRRSTTRGIIPPPSTSPDGPDVPTVATGEIIESAWGSAVSADLAELWNDKAAATTAIATTAPLTGGGDLSTSRTLAISTFTPTVKGAVPPPTTVTGNYLRDDGTWGAGGTGITAEDAVDAVAAAMAVPSGGITVTYNDPANTLTVGTSAIPTANVAGLDTALAGKQPLDTDLTTIAGLTATTDNVIQSVSSAWASRTPAQLKTSLGLTKTDVGLGSVDNTADTAKPISTATQTALDAKAPIRRTIKADTTTAYAPILTDENQMVTLSNAAAITVTMPQNSAVAFPVGAEVDFLWLGVGQPTFVAGSGATVNGTPGLKLRAQYSAATLKKISTNGWVALGDLSA